MSASRIVLVTPPVADADAFAGALGAACAGGRVAALILVLAEGDERTLVNRVKRLAPVAQAEGAAVLVAGEGFDPAAVAIRGGADGAHVAGAPEAARLRPALTDGRILGAGDLRSRHDAMEAGEAGVDYVLFGEPRADGTTPPYSAVRERAEWWAEIFETPCVAYAPDLSQVADLAATGVEFVALGDAVWSHPAGVDAAMTEALAAFSARAMA